MTSAERVLRWGRRRRSLYVCVTPSHREPNTTRTLVPTPITKGSRSLTPLNKETNMTTLYSGSPTTLVIGDSTETLVGTGSDIFFIDRCAGTVNLK